jgi:hypothetical protein
VDVEAWFHCTVLVLYIEVIERSKNDAIRDFMSPIFESLLKCLEGCRRPPQVISVFGVLSSFQKIRRVRFNRIIFTADLGRVRVRISIYKHADGKLQTCDFISDANPSLGF